MTPVPCPDLVPMTRPLQFRVPGRVSLPLAYARSSTLRRHTVFSLLGTPPSDADANLLHAAGRLVRDTDHALLAFPGAWLRIAGEDVFYPQPTLATVLAPVAPDADFAYLAGPGDARGWALQIAEGCPEGHLVEISPAIEPTAHARLAFAARVPASVLPLVAGRETLHPLQMLHAPGALLLLAGPMRVAGCCSSDHRPTLLCAWPLPPA